MKRVYAASNLPEAHLLIDVLADRGIRARVFNAHASSLAGELPIEASLPQVWVENPQDAERAREIIDAFTRSVPSGGYIKCAACQEDNPLSFDVCWACGSGLEGCSPR